MDVEIPNPIKPYMAWIKLALGVVGLGIVGFVVWKLFFADIQRRVAAEHGGKVVAQEQTQGAKETGIDATNTVVHTYERHVEVDHVVRESQNAVNRADHGQQMDPAIDAATAAGLCGVHDSLCRHN
jgi:hypothetical protein